MRLVKRGESERECIGMEDLLWESRGEFRRVGMLYMKWNNVRKRIIDFDSSREFCQSNKTKGCSIPSLYICLTSRYATRPASSQKLPTYLILWETTLLYLRYDMLYRRFLTSKQLKEPCMIASPPRSRPETPNQPSRRPTIGLQTEMHILWVNALPMIFLAFCCIAIQPGGLIVAVVARLMGFLEREMDLCWKYRHSSGRQATTREGR